MNSSAIVPLQGTGKHIIDANNISWLVTNETSQYYICHARMFKKTEVLHNYHPIDDVKGKVRLRTSMVYN